MRRITLQLPLYLELVKDGRPTDEFYRTTRLLETPEMWPSAAASVRWQLKHGQTDAATRRALRACLKVFSGEWQVDGPLELGALVPSNPTESDGQ